MTDKQKLFLPEQQSESLNAKIVKQKALLKAGLKESRLRDWPKRPKLNAYRLRQRCTDSPISSTSCKQLLLLQYSFHLIQ